MTVSCKMFTLLVHWFRVAEFIIYVHAVCRSVQLQYQIPVQVHQRPIDLFSHGHVRAYLVCCLEDPPYKENSRLSPSQSVSWCCVHLTRLHPYVATLPELRLYYIQSTLASYLAPAIRSKYLTINNNQEPQRNTFNTPNHQ